MTSPKNSPIPVLVVPTKSSPIPGAPLPNLFSKPTSLLAIYDIHPSCQIARETLAGMFNKYFPGKFDGIYVEVGAFDGVTFGNTSALAKLGWRGLCIEPHPEFAERCRQNHQGRNVSVVACAVGASEGTVTLYVSSFEGGALSSTRLTDATQIYELDESRSIKVPMYRLDNILQQNGIAPGFDVLSIDVEESEMDVLAGFNIKKWLPKLVFIETHEKDPNPIRNWKAEPINELFTAAGYEKIYADHINSVFVRV